VGDDGLRHGARVDGYDVGPRAGLEAIRLQAERARSAVGGRLQRHLDLLIAPEGTAVGEMHGPFQHVAAAERAPQVADAVVAAGDGDSGGTQSGDGRDREVVGGGGDEADPGIGQLPAEPVLGGLVGLGQAVGVADRDAAAESGRLGPFR